MVKELPLSEINLRRYEKPYLSSKRELARKVCLSLGLLQPGDSRDVVVDVLIVLDDLRKKREWVGVGELREKVRAIREQHSLETKGLAESNIRRQLKRLREMMVVDKQGNQYRLAEFMPLSEIFKERIESFLLPKIVERVKEYLKEFDESDTLK
ncbi:hypothetical protein D6817_02900 [Candidatus Pacearchaeota archaeon]|nr:MAG: hypothetical protein D6817_02900 [Candidatus Pacearchaeota archaeon]